MRNTKTNGPLAGKTALVTGSSRGIGRAIALRYAADGARLIINYKQNEQAAREVAEEIAQGGGNAVIAQGDVSTVDGIRAFFGNVGNAMNEADFKIDILVANAGVIHAAPFEDTLEEDFDRLVNTNLKGVFFLVQQALPRLLDGGHIITLSSGLARFSIPPYIAYAMTKRGIEAFTQYLAQTLGVRGITANCIAPGAINTDMNRERLANPGFRKAIQNMAALKRIGEADDISSVAAFLASDDSRWLTGQRLEASGGAVLGPA